MEALFQLLFADGVGGNAVVELGVAVHIEIAFQPCYPVGGDSHAVALHEVAQLVFACLAVFFLLVSDVVFDVLLGARGLCLAQPFLGGEGLLRGEHLYLFAAVQPVAQWNHSGVDFGAYAVFAQLRVDGIGEVKHRRP